MHHHSTAASAGSIDGGEGSVRTLGRFGLALLALCLLIASFGAVQAQALDRYQPAGFINGPSGLTRAAVEEATGNVLVVSSASGEVLVYGPGGAATTQIASFGAGQLSSPFGIAIDQSNGNVYVSDAGNERIVRYTSDGQPTPTYTLDATYEGPDAGNDPTVGEVEGFDAPLAVDPENGDLLVGDRVSNYLLRFESDGTFVSSFDGSATAAGPFTHLLDVAVGDGVTYVLDSTDPTLGQNGEANGESRVERFAANGSSLGPITPGSRLNKARAIAYGSGTGSLFVVVQNFGLQSLKLEIYRADQPFQTVAFQGAGSVFGVAADDYTASSSARVYALTDILQAGGTPGFEVFDRLRVPDVLIDPVSNIENRSAGLSGSVDPVVGTATTHFEYSSDGGASWTPVPTDDETATAPDTAHPTASITGLTPFTTYQVRLVAQNEAGEVVSPVVSFKTLGDAPAIEAESAIERDANSPSVRALITAYGQATSFHVEYGPTAAYGARVPVANERAAGASQSPYGAVQTIAGLQPGTTYHYRFVAKNASGETIGADNTFTTVDTAPAARAYELVTPADKGGNNVREELGLQASADGNTLTYLGTVVLGGQAEADPLYPRYVAQRSATGWSSSKPTDPLQLPLQAGTGAINLTFGVSEDGTKAVVMSLKALAPGAVDGNTNLYLRDVATGALTTMGTAEGDDLFNKDTGTETSVFAGGTPNFSHVLLRPANTSFLPGVPDGALYDFTGGKLEVVSLSPDGTPLPAGSLGTSSHDQHPISSDGSRIVFGTASAVYLRSDGTTRVLSASRRASDPGTVQAARLIGSSRDLRYTFFFSHDLTDESEPGLDTLYRYDANTDELQTLTRTIGVDVEKANVGGMQVSADGNTVVFVSRAALTADESFGQKNLYMWRAGELSLIAPLDISLDIDSTLGISKWWLSPNGRYFVFESGTKLTDYDPASSACVNHSGGDNDVTCREIYRYDGDTGDTVCASCRPDGNPPIGNATIGWDRNENGTHAFPRSVNDEGHVFFTTPESLVTQDTNSAPDVYEFDGEQARLISTGKGSGAKLAEVSEDGSNVFFTTRDQLVAIDTDSAIDVYDARVGGGIPAQNQLPPSISCAGEDCRPAADAVPPPPPAGSEVTKSRGNASRHTQRCGKGRVPRKVKGKQRCVKKQKKSQKSRANNDRRQGR